MLINEELLKAIIKSKIEKKYLKEAPEDRARRQQRRQKRRERRQEKRSDVQQADTRAEKRAVRQSYRAERRAARDADRFERDDAGVDLSSMLAPDYSNDAIYQLIVEMVNEVIPGIEKFENRHKGVRFIKRIRGRREQKVTIGQVKRFIKNGLTLTLEKNYPKAADAFCAASVFLENPKTPDEQPLNVEQYIIDKLEDICKMLGSGDFGQKSGKVASKKGKGTGGGGNTVACVKEIQESLNEIAVELTDLVIDGKWGSLTTTSWNHVIKTYFRPGDEYNGVVVDDTIISAVLKTWPSGGPMIGFEGNPCGARDFLLAMIEKLGEGGGEVVPSKKEDVNDCQWYTRRKPLEGAQDINLGALLAGDGLTIDLVYDMKEFKKYNPGETFDDFTQIGHYISIGDVKGFGSQEAQREASGGPDAHSGMVFSADAYYYNCETRELLIDTSTGDGVLQHVWVDGNVLKYDSARSDAAEAAGNTTESKLRLDKKKIREIIRTELLNEALGVEDVRTLLTSLVGKIVEMDKDGLEAVTINQSQKSGFSALQDGNIERATQQFKAAAAAADRYEGTSITKEDIANIKNTFLAIADGIQPDSKKEKEEVEKVVDKIEGEGDGKGSAKKASKKPKTRAGNSKTKKVQELLNYLNDNNPQLETDGIWGKGTTSGYNAFIDSLTDKGDDVKAAMKKSWAEYAKTAGYTPNVDGLIDFLEKQKDNKIEASTSDQTEDELKTTDEKATEEKMASLKTVFRDLRTKLRPILEADNDGRLWPHVIATSENSKVNSSNYTASHEVNNRMNFGTRDYTLNFDFDNVDDPGGTGTIVKLSVKLGTSKPLTTARGTEANYNSVKTIRFDNQDIQVEGITLGELAEMPATKPIFKAVESSTAVTGQQAARFATSGVPHDRWSGPEIAYLAAQLLPSMLKLKVQK